MKPQWCALPWDALSQTAITIHTTEAGQVSDRRLAACLKVLAVTARGAVFLLEWGSFRALLPVGVDFEQLENLST